MSGGKTWLLAVSFVWAGCTAPKDQNAAEKTQAKTLKDLAELHQLYLEGENDELLAKASLLLAAMRFDATASENALELLTHAVKRSCRLPIVTLADSMLDLAKHSVVLSERRAKAKDVEKYTVDLRLAWRAADRPHELFLRKKSGAAFSTSLTRRNGDAETYVSALLDGPLPFGLYDLTAKLQDGTEASLMRFFWLDHLSRPRTMTLLEPARQQTYTTGTPSFRWQIQRADKAKECSTTAHALTVKDLGTQKTWHNHELPEETTKSVFARTAGWSHATPLESGDYRVTLTTTQAAHDARVRLQAEASWDEDVKLVVKGYHPCRLNFGTSWDEGEHDPIGFSYYFAWIGWKGDIASNYYRMMLNAANLGQKAEGLTPAYMAELTTQLAMNDTLERRQSERALSPEEGLAFRQDFMQMSGAHFLRTHRSRILEAFANQARETALILGDTGDILWFIEPFIMNLTGSSQKPSPLTLEEVREFLADTYYTVKRELAFARMIFPAAGDGVPREKWARWFEDEGLEIDAWQYVPQAKDELPPFANAAHEAGGGNFLHLFDASDGGILRWLARPQLQTLFDARIGALSFMEPSSIVRQRVAALASEHHRPAPSCKDHLAGQEGRMSAHLKDVDFLYGDFQRLQKATPEACEKACLDEFVCRAWTWSRPYCYLKNVVLRRQKAEGLISGQKLRSSLR